MEPKMYNSLDYDGLKWPIESCEYFNVALHMIFAIMGLLETVSLFIWALMYLGECHLMTLGYEM